MHNETGIGNVFVAETVGELVADFGRGAVAVGAGQGELQIFLRGFVRRIRADGAGRQHCQHGDGHQQPAELAHQRFCRGTSEYCGHIETFFSAAGQLPDRYGGQRLLRRSRLLYRIIFMNYRLYENHSDTLKFHSL